MPCNGLPPDRYDLYVLGLLEGKERSELEQHIGHDCPACLQHLRRSLDLWIMFASTLADNVEPSPEFRARLIRLSELSKTIPLTLKTRSNAFATRTSPWAVLLLSSLLVSVLILGAWYAGHRSATIQAEQLSARLNLLSQSVAQNEVLLQQEKTRRRTAEDALRSSGNSLAAAEQEHTQTKLAQAEAAANQYKTALLRQQESASDEARIVDFLSTPGVRFLKFKGAEAASSSTVYAFLAERNKLFLIASGLPKLPEGKAFQIWLLRKPDNQPQNAGVFSPGDDNRAAVSIEAVPWDEISGIAITDESAGGSPSPTGTRLLAANIDNE